MCWRHFQFQVFRRVVYNWIFVLFFLFCTFCLWKLFYIFIFQAYTFRCALLIANGMLACLLASLLIPCKYVVYILIKLIVFLEYLLSRGWSELIFFWRRTNGLKSYKRASVKCKGYVRVLRANRVKIQPVHPVNDSLQPNIWL